MPHLPSLPEDADLRDLAALFPEPLAGLRAFGERLMYGGSPFTLGERELIAGFVSGVNACAYCHGIHAAVAAEHGIDRDLFATLMTDLGQAPVDDRWRALFVHLRKLTETPARITKGDVDRLFAAGWDERSIFDATLICGYFNLLNRLVDGVGIATDDAGSRAAAKRIAAEGLSG